MASNHHFLKSALESFWMANSEQDQNRDAKVLLDIKSLLDPLLIGLYERDPLLNFNPLNATTVRQGAKNYIYEGLLCLKDFHSSENELSIEDGKSPTGFALAKLSNKTSPSDEFCVRSNSGKKYLSPKIISEKLLSHLRVLLTENILRDRSRDFQLDLLEQLEDNAVCIKFDSLREPFKLHLLPTIPCSHRWIFGANSWLAEESHWPSKTIKREAVAKGVHLVGRSAPTKSPCQWQITFLEPMQMLLANSNSCRRKCLEVSKSIVSRSQPLQKGVTVFLLETVNLKLYKMYPQANFWGDEKFVRRFIDLIEELRKAIRARKMSDFFLFELNLLKDMDDQKAEVCDQQLTKLLDDPKQFFLDLKAQVVQDTHL